jgi:23S rRNA pseudouridine2605 synthase
MKFEQITDSGGQGANHWYHVVLKEGKNREVRRLWQSQGIMVSRLIRVRYGNIILPRDLKQGKKRELSLDEIKALFDFVKLEWPKSRDEAAKERSKKAKNLSIKKQLYGSHTRAKTFHPHAGQRRKAGTGKKTRSVQPKGKHR